MSNGWLIVSLVLATTAGEAVRPQPGCIQARYDAGAVSLTGVVRRHTFPGPPNYESVRDGDEAETGFYLHLDRGLCIPSDGDNDAARDVRTVQLVLDSAGYAALRPHLGQRITVTGRIFGWHTGHHHAPVLVWLMGVPRWQLGVAPRPVHAGRPASPASH